MHVRVTYVQIRPDKVEEATRLYQDSVRQHSNIKGFRGMTLMTDRATGKGISMSRWESEAEDQASLLFSLRHPSVSCLRTQPCSAGLF